MLRRARPLLNRNPDPEPVEVYRARAAEQRELAEQSDLGGVRERALAAAKAWDEQARRSELVATLAARRQTSSGSRKDDQPGVPA